MNEPGRKVGRGRREVKRASRRARRIIVIDLSAAFYCSSQCKNEDILTEEEKRGE